MDSGNKSQKQKKGLWSLEGTREIRKREEREEVHVTVKDDGMKKW